MQTVKIVLELDPEQAAALHRLCDKLGHDDAMGFLYPHVAKSIRVNQAYTILQAASIVQSALEDQAKIGHWHWIESGRVLR